VKEKMKQPVKRIAIVPYKLGSASTRVLAEALRKIFHIPVIRVRTTSVKYQPRWTDYVINWGCSKEWPWINLTPKVANQIAVDKLEFFQKIRAWNEQFKDYPESQVNIPEWTTDKEEAVKWYFGNVPFVARKILNGHSGQGIVLYGQQPEEYEKFTGDVVKAPLYVQYKKKKHEYRVHIFKQKDGTYKVIDVTQKKRKAGFEGRDNQIRNHQNGWIYARENIVEPAGLRSLACLTAAALGISFGAVDIIWNEKENKCYVLEFNSAPGLTGTTLTNYVNAFVEDIKNAG
jgi:hypothetical protein